MQTEKITTEQIENSIKEFFAEETDAKQAWGWNDGDTILIENKGGMPIVKAVFANHMCGNGGD